MNSQNQPPKPKAEDIVKGFATLAVVIFVVWIFFIPSCGDEKSSDTSQSEKVNEEVKRTPAELNQQLKLEIESFKTPKDYSQLQADATQLQIQIAVYSIWGKLIQEALVSTDSETLKLGSELKTLVQKRQLEELPYIRKKYAELLSKVLWENDISVKSSGPRHQYINFTGAIFVTNKNIKDLHDQLAEAFSMYRFEQARYEWYKDATDYQNLKMQPLKDEDLYLSE